MNFFFFYSETMSKVLNSFKNLELKGNFKTGSYINFEYIFGNISFIVLFIAVLLYWFDFSDTKPVTKKLKNFCMWSSNLSLTFLLIVRWWESGHFPLSNLYESLIGLAWGFTTVHLIITFDVTNFFRKNKNETTLVFTSYALGVPGTYSPSSPKEYKSEHKLNSKGCGSCSDTLTPNFTPWGDRSIYENQNPKVGAKSATERTLPLTRPEVSLLGKRINNAELGHNTNSPFVPHYGGAQRGGEVEYVNNLQQKNNEKIGAITAPTALLTSVFATFFLPPEMLKTTTLIPALKSNWLTMHVSVMVTSYAFLLVGSLLSIAFCAYRFVTISEFGPLRQNRWSFFKYIWPFQSADLQGNQNKSDAYSSNRNKAIMLTPSNSLTSSSLKISDKGSGLTSHNEGDKSFWPLDFTTKTSKLNQNPSIDQNKANEKKNQLDICIWLNTTSYRILGLGFPLLTIGILSGAVWANEAWGSYWSWDPKETWALITWLVFAIYFHSRYNRSSEDSVIPASIASVGFVVIWICYLGVNLLGKGLHSYGGFGV